MFSFIDEMSQDFIDYCYQTNIERAFPAIDGLKPGQRACLYEMFRKSYLPSKPHVKSAKVSGGVIAELWPHGDVAIYETFARMAQNFTNNSPLCEFHGSCGNQIVPEAASSRYTEVRLSKLGLEMFEGIKKNSVPFILNFDETVSWPEVLPSALPMLMINGSEGIGTTIAQKWLPYDLTEVSEAYKKFLQTGEMDYTLCPSFPSGGIIINKNELSTILKTGKGKVVLRAKAEIQKNVIYITEICYQTCVRDLMEEFKKAYDAGELEGVEDIQNASGKNGVCIKIFCERGSDPQKVLNILYKKTNLQKSYSANQNLLINKVPKLVNTAEYFQLLYKHNDECLVREYSFDKEKAEKKKEECEGLLIAIAHIDDIIKIVRNSDDKVAAKTALIEAYNFTSYQADCILKMTIGQLTKLDGVRIEDELKSLISTLAELNSLLNSDTLRLNKIIENIDLLIKKYQSKRKTELMNIVVPKEEKEIAEVIPEDVVVVLTQTGDIKRVPVKSFKVQKKNGKGVKTADEAILDTISTNTIDTLMFFTNKGKMYRTVVDNIPAGTNAAKGVKITTIITLEPDEQVIAMTSLYRKTTAKYVVFFTKKGLIKKSLIEEYTKVKRSTGIQAIKLADDDSIANVTFLDNEEVVLITKNGMSIHFDTASINPIGRVTAGVKSIKLAEDDEVLIGLPIHDKNDQIAIFSENGFGKKTKLEDFPYQSRGGKGVMCYHPTGVTGNVVGAAMVSDSDNVLLIGKPNSICISASDVPTLTRISIGNMLIKNSKIIYTVKF